MSINLIAIAALLNSALYLIGVFVAGIIAHNLEAEYGAILTAAICYLHYAAQMMGSPSRTINVAFVICTVVIGGASGIALFV